MHICICSDILLLITYTIVFQPCVNDGVSFSGVRCQCKKPPEVSVWGMVRGRGTPKFP